jgi:hypothetical protein
MFKIILLIATTLLISLIVIGGVLIPHLDNFWMWLIEILISCWITVTIIFIVIFKNFIKDERKEVN